MRVLHVTDDVTYTGGIRSYLLDLTAGMAARGHETEIYSPSGMSAAAGALSRWASFRCRREVAAAIDRFRPDLVHAHSLSLRVSPLPLGAARRRGVPVVMTVHDFGLVCPRKWAVTPDGAPCAAFFGPRCLVLDCLSGRRGRRHLPYHGLRWLKTALHRALVRRYVDLFVCPSRALAGPMASFAGPGRARHLPNFAAPLPGAGKTAPAGGGGLLYAGRLSPEKGVSLLLEALPLVRDRVPGTTLTLAGDGPERERLRRRAGELGLQDAVTFAGEVDRDALGGFYRRALLAVMPSLWMENCPVAALESLSFGLPVAGSDRGGIPEIVGDGEAGVVFPPGDRRALADAVAGLLEDRKRLDALRRRARRRWEERYTFDGHCEGLLRLYREAVR